MIGMSTCALIDEGTHGSPVLLSLNAYFLYDRGGETTTLFVALEVRVYLEINQLLILVNVATYLAKI